MLTRFLHIHSDQKFIHNTELSFKNPEFENTIVYFGKLDVSFEGNIICLDYNYKNFEKVANIAKNYDAIVFYSMCLQHAIICNKLPSKIIVFWRFFGAELYPYLYKEMLSRESLNYVKNNYMHRILSITKHLLIDHMTADQIFWKAVNRCNYMICLSDYEYHYLKEKFTILPDYINVPYQPISNDFIYPKDGKTIIVGHSKDIYGNHLEVLYQINRNSCRDEYFYYLPFSYAEYSKSYSREVESVVSIWPTANVIKNFISFEEYTKILQNSSAIVSNTYRQMAMGNVFLAFNYGIKVYMNPKNVMYQWLIDNGFYVFTIDQLLHDMGNKEISLTKGQMKENQLAFNRLSSKFSVESFCKLLLTIVRNV